MSQPSFWVTGAQGFVGRALINALSLHYPVLGISRLCVENSISCVQYEDIFDFQESPKKPSFAPTHLIHCAALAHRSPPRTFEQLTALSSVNIDLPLRLAELSKRIGVRRFVFLSSIGVHGTSTPHGLSFSESSPLCPANSYSASKYDAEAKLRECLAGSSCELTIIRPTLVYGQNVPGNLRILMRAIDAGFPLPLGLVRNIRSFISLDNLVSAIHSAALHPNAAGQDYVVADAETISTVDLIRTIAHIRNKQCRLLPVPVGFLRVSSNLPLIGGKIGQLINDLVVDISKICDQLDWHPPLNQEEALEKAFVTNEFL